MELTDNAPHILQKVELSEEIPWTVTEHQAAAYYCPQCQQVHYASIPSEVERGGMLGPRLMALIAYLKGAQHASFSTIRKYFRDVLKLPISRSRLAKAIDQVSQALKDAYDELGDQLAQQPTLRVDETGHKNNAQRHWTWCFLIEERTLSIGLGVKGSSQGDEGGPELLALSKSSLGRHVVPLGPLRRADIFDFDHPSPRTSFGRVG